MITFLNYDLQVINNVALTINPDVLLYLWAARRRFRRGRANQRSRSFLLPTVFYRWQNEDTRGSLSRARTYIDVRSSNKLTVAPFVQITSVVQYYRARRFESLRPAARHNIPLERAAAVELDPKSWSPRTSTPKIIPQHEAR